MCIIVDANQAALFLTSSYRAIRSDILKGKAQVVVGGKLYDELAKVSTFRAYLLELLRSGHARRCDEEAVRLDTELVSKLPDLRSDDPHVLALARQSGARLLVSKDMNLIADFKDRRIVPNPRGKVYTTRSHSRLLRRCCVP